MTVCCIINT